MWDNGSVYGRPRRLYFLPCRVFWGRSAHSDNAGSLQQSDNESTASHGSSPATSSLRLLMKLAILPKAVSRRVANICSPGLRTHHVKNSAVKHSQAAIYCYRARCLGHALVDIRSVNIRRHVNQARCLLCLHLYVAFTLKAPL